MNDVNNHPHINQIVNTLDSDFSSQYFIAIEQFLLVECKSMESALLTAFVAHDIFNIEYRKEFLFLYTRKLVSDSSNIQEKRYAF